MGKLLRFFIILFGVCALALCGLGVYIYSYGGQDKAAPSDVIVVLGAGTRRDGSASPAHTRRIRHGVALYKQGLAPYVLCTGGYTMNHPTSEARACSTLAVSLGVPAEAIILEEASKSTEENAIEVAKIMRERSFQKALLVSDNFHLWRAEWLFRAYGVSVITSPAQITVGPLPTQIAWQNTTREMAATAWYVFKTLLGLPQTNF
jgi:uncharacterized SAM-binding protein YcdF (DUF218 family)